MLKHFIIIWKQWPQQTADQSKLSEGIYPLLNVRASYCITKLGKNIFYLFIYLTAVLHLTLQLMAGEKKSACTGLELGTGHGTGEGLVPVLLC